MYVTSTTWGKKDKGMQLARQDVVANERDVLKKRKLTYLPIHGKFSFLR